MQHLLETDPLIGPMFGTPDLEFCDALPVPANDSAQPWLLADAVALARCIEAIAPKYGAHVALTGGTLYKDGYRKDADFLFYRIRQVAEIDRDGLLYALQELGLVIGKRFGWVQKATYQGKPIDLFFPDHVDNSKDPITGNY